MYNGNYILQSSQGRTKSSRWYVYEKFKGCDTLRGTSVTSDRSTGKDGEGFESSGSVGRERGENGMGSTPRVSKDP